MAVSVGLELGTSIVRAVRLERRGSGIRLVASAQVPWSGEPGEDLTSSLKQIRKALLIKHPVVVGLPTSSSIVTTVSPLVVNQKRSALAIQFELQQHLPYDVGQALWHYQWLSTNGGAGRSSQSMGPIRRAVVAAMKQSLLEERLRSFQQAGLAVEGVGVAAVAAANAWFRHLGTTDPPNGVLLHMDGPVLEWVVVTPKGLHVFPTLCNLEASGTQQTLEILKASWDTLLEQLAPEAPLPARAERSEAGGPPVSRVAQTAPTVWLLGESAVVPHFADDLKRELACGIEILNPSRLVTLGPASPPDPERLVVALGLALQGLGVARLPMNLLVEVARQRRVKQVRRIARVVSVLCALLAVTFSASDMATVLMRRNHVLQDLMAQEQTHQKLRPVVQLLRRRQVQLEHRLKQLEELALARARILQAFQQLSETLPDEVWLTKLELSKNETLDGVLEGYSRSFQGVTRLMDQLKSSVGWTTVKPQATTVTTSPTTGEELIAFTVQIQRPLRREGPLPSGTTDVSEQHESNHAPSR